MITDKFIKKHKPKILIVLFIILGILIFSIHHIRTIQYKNLFYSTNNYPELKIIEDNWDIIASEIPKIDINNLEQYPIRPRDAWNNIDAVNYLFTLQSNWVRGWQGASWYNFPLMYHNNIIDKAEKICPKTINILKSLPFIQIAGYSLLLPKSKLDTHTDETGKRNNSMACNLLLTNNNANLYVLNRTYKHKIGKAVIFDSNLQHYADNKDDDIRIILYIDFKTDIIYGTKYSGFGIASNLGYPTINIKLLNKYKCGMYSGFSEFGEVIVIVLKNNDAECHYKKYDKKIDELNIIYIYDVKPIESVEDSIVGIYNKGCCD